MMQHSITLLPGQIAFTKPRGVFGVMILLENKCWPHKVQTSCYGMLIQNVVLVMLVKCALNFVTSKTPPHHHTPSMLLSGNHRNCTFTQFLMVPLLLFDHEGLTHIVSSEQWMLKYVCYLNS